MTNIIIEDTKQLKILNDKLHDLTVTEIKELTSDQIQQLIRLSYLETFVKPQPSCCPECGGTLNTTIDEDETICEKCGLITSMSIEYVAGNKINLPYGRH